MHQTASIKIMEDNLNSDNGKEYDNYTYKFDKSQQVLEKREGE